MSQIQRLRLHHRLIILFFVTVIFASSTLLMYIRTKILRNSKLMDKTASLKNNHHQLTERLRSYKIVSSVIGKHENSLVPLLGKNDQSINVTIFLQKAAQQQKHLSILNSVDNQVKLSNSPTGLNKKNMTKKLKFVYHIGPMKTGSTTLQRAHIEDKDVLKLDGYLYGLNGLLLANQCLDRMPNRCAGSVKWRNVFLPYLKEHSQENLFLSDEMFGVMADWDGNWKLLQKTIGETWDLHFIVTYRRFFEWFVSFYFQAHRYGMPEERITTRWPLASTAAALQTTKASVNTIPTISDYFEKLQREKNGFANVYVKRWGDTFGKMHPMEVQKNKFEKHYPGVKIFNFHQEPDNMVGSFYCNVFPGPQSHACKHRKRIGTPHSIHQNLSGSHNYDMLSVAAFHSHVLIQRDLQRPAVAEAARRHQEEVLKLSDKDFPLICMSPQQLNNLLEMSLEFERRILPEWYKTPQGEQDHRVCAG